MLPLNSLIHLPMHTHQPLLPTLLTDAFPPCIQPPLCMYVWMYGWQQDKDFFEGCYRSELMRRLLANKYGEGAYTHQTLSGRKACAIQ